jgi:YfiH family protein
MKLIIPEWPDLPQNIKAMTTLRTDGVSQAPFDDGVGGGGFNVGEYVGDVAPHVAINRAALEALVPSSPLWLKQVHGVLVVDSKDYVAGMEADASLTKEAGRVCVAQTADCLPLLLSDMKGTMVSAVHAGWRGLCDGIIEAVVNKMYQAGAVEITAWMGPAIGPACFEVGADVVAQFVEKDSAAKTAFVLVEMKENHFLGDLYELARQRLAKCGVNRVYGGTFCTMTQEDKFYSYRRDGVTGRMASLIWMER